eukprot:31175-Pelagococcus_subviridis.AAC.6
MRRRSRGARARGSSRGLPRATSTARTPSSPPRSGSRVSTGCSPSRGRSTRAARPRGARSIGRSVVGPRSSTAARWTFGI